MDSRTQNSRKRQLTTRSRASRRPDPTDFSYLTFMAHPKEERGLLTDLGFIASLYHRHPLCTPDARTLDLTERTAFFLLLRTWVTAQYRLLASLDSRYAHRYLAFVDNLRREYRIRCSETPSAADYWLLRQVDQMRLPDQRQDK